MKKVVSPIRNEVWVRIDFQKPTKGCFYEISNMGRIKSIDKFTEDERLLKGAIVNRGFKVLNVTLRDNSRGIIYVHKFVAENFVNKTSEEHNVVVHKDYDKSDNSWQNLTWITEQQWEDYLDNKPGFTRERKGIKSHYKLNESKVKMIKRMLARGKTKREIIARNFGVTENTIYQIEKGYRWSHVKV